MNDPKVYHEQVCPRCGERYDVTADTIQGDGDVVWHNTTCNKCGYRFVEVYKYICTEVYDENN